jgi:N-acyl-D-aspartate/D-glutamate deacylase
MSMEEAVRKMTSPAATRVGLLDRGIHGPGVFADIAVFDSQEPSATPPLSMIPCMTRWV